MKLRLSAWAPAVILVAGVALSSGGSRQQKMSLREPLDAVVPASILGMAGTDVTISEDEQRVAGMDEYLLRNFTSAAGEFAFSVYVGFYASQMQGRTIHSPKNCLPGSGWEVLSSQPLALNTSLGNVTVQQYLIKNGNEQAMVLYWYQGRGRIESNEYAVKWHLLRDAALRRRSDEALVRVLVPFTGTADDAVALASRVAVAIIPALDRALPL